MLPPEKAVTLTRRCLVRNDLRDPMICRWLWRKNPELYTKERKR